MNFSVSPKCEQQHERPDSIISQLNAPELCSSHLDSDLDNENVENFKQSRIKRRFSDGFGSFEELKDDPEDSM